MLFLALSIFQGRTQDAALDALLLHDPQAVQLTPGNLSSPGFAERVDALDLVTRPHHGFAWDRYRRRVWRDDGRPLVIERDRSVHPPRTTGPSALDLSIDAWLEIVSDHDLLLETMYPGYLLGTGDELERAIDARLRLAVDVSHLHIQRCAGKLSDHALRRLLEYERVEEIHVSANNGRADLHTPLCLESPGLAWARERLADVPVVLESYWHRVSFDDQRRQLDLILG